MVKESMRYARCNSSPEVNGVVRFISLQNRWYEDSNIYSDVDERYQTVNEFVDMCIHIDNEKGLNMVKYYPIPQSVTTIRKLTISLQFNTNAKDYELMKLFKYELYNANLHIETLLITSNTNIVKLTDISFETQYCMNAFKQIFKFDCI